MTAALLLAWLAADLSGTWTGSVNGTPLCLAVSQQGREVSGHVAYENDRKYAEIEKGVVEQDRLSFEVKDLDRGSLNFRFNMAAEKLTGEDGAVLTRWVQQRNRQFDAGLLIAPRAIKTVSPNYGEETRKAGLSGTVKLAVLILTNGDVGPNVKVLQSVGKAMDADAIEAVKKWKFTPPREDCSFLEKRITVEFHFSV